MVTTSLHRPTRNDLAEDIRSDMVTMLEHHLVSAIDLALQAKQAHWNVQGPNFIAIHELFDKVTDEVRGYSDMIAERIVQLGGMADGTAKRVASGSYLPEFQVGQHEERMFIEQVSEGLSTFAKHTRQGIDKAAKGGDAVTADLLTEVARGTDKLLYFVESHIL